MTPPWEAPSVPPRPFTRREGVESGAARSSQGTARANPGGRGAKEAIEHLIMVPLSVTLTSFTNIDGSSPKNHVCATYHLSSVMRELGLFNTRSGTSGRLA
eukprot:5548281-Prymnesium_polylepis.3